METHYISHQAAILIGVFLVVYLLILIRLALRYNLDLVDFFMLTTVAAVPGGFVLFPDLVQNLCHVLKIDLPLVLLFGILMTIVFGFLIRLLRRCFKLENKLREMAQEIALRSTS